MNEVLQHHVPGFYFPVEFYEDEGQGLVNGWSKLVPHYGKSLKYSEQQFNGNGRQGLLDVASCSLQYVEDSFVGSLDLVVYEMSLLKPYLGKKDETGYPIIYWDLVLTLGYLQRL
jgi:hypothetical protein